MSNKKYITPNWLKRQKFSKSNLRISRRKRDIGVVLHSAWENYEKELYNHLCGLNRREIKTRDFESQLMKTREKIMKSFPHSRYLQEISKFLHKLIQDIRKTTKNITSDSIFTINDFIFHHFGGIPHFEEEVVVNSNGIVFTGRIDQLIITPEDKLIIKDLKPDFDLVRNIDKNPSLFQLSIYAYLTEVKLSKKCEKIILIDYNLQTQEILFDNDLRSYIALEISNILNLPNLDLIMSSSNNKKIMGENSIKIDKRIKFEHQGSKELEKEKKYLNSLEDGFNIGWCVARRSKKPNLSIRQLSKIKGYIEDKQKLNIVPGIYVVVEITNSSEEIGGHVRIISKIINIKPYLDTISLIKNSMSENIIEVEIEPLYEISEGDGYLGKVRPHIFDRATIRFCTDDETIELLQVPRAGFEIGEIEGYGNREIKYKLPYQKLEESVCILGTQGTGKTTLIYGMASKFAGDLNIKQAERASIVILDIESEYQNLDSENFRISNEGFFKNYGISDKIQINKYKIGKEDYTLDLSLVEPEEYIYFIPNLTTKTSEAYISIATKVKEDLLNANSFSKNNLIQGIKDHIRTGKAQYLHTSTMQAVLRACDAKNFELFDRLGCKKISIKELVRPATINVIDVFDLNDQEQRIVALYFMLVFYRAKMKSENNSKNILALVIDEAHRIFPRTSNISAEKDYIDRIVSKVGEITHRGRKRHYGVIFATQSPKDLKKEIITTCNTKIFFRIAGETLLLSEVLERHDLKDIANLPVGLGIITCQGIHKSIKVRFPHLNIK